MSVVKAFINGNLEKEIYMEVPTGFRNFLKPSVVFRLLKAFYGLKQAPGSCYAKVLEFVKKMLKFENWLYVRKSGIEREGRDPKLRTDY